MNRFATFVVALATVVASFACGGPTTPSPTPTPTPPPYTPPPTPPTPTITLHVVDGLTGAPVVGATVSGTTSKTDGSGNVSTVLNVGQTVSVSGAAGFRDRNTLYCGGDITLWQNKPGGVDEALTQIGYLWETQMSYPHTVGWFPSDEILGNVNAMAGLQDAAAYVTAKSRTVVTIGVSGEWNNSIRINPNSLYSGQTAPGPNGFVEFGSLSTVANRKIVRHEGFRTTGITGSSPYPGLLSAGVASDTLTPAEADLIHLRYTRPNGARFAGDDDTNVPCSAR